MSQLNQAEAQGFERWFQIDLTVFSNESAAERERETWQPPSPELSFPPEMTRLARLTDLLLLDFSAAEEEAEATDAEVLDAAALAAAAAERNLARLRETGPFPARPGNGIRFPDLQRDPFVELPAANSDFRQTNRALEQSAQYRPLFNAVWRQPVGDPGSATPIFVAGGDRYGSLTELQGAIAFNFNAGRDRVILSADLWLSEFGTTADGEQWSLPPLPEEFAESTGNTAAPPITRIYSMRQQRELRSNEFHYLDHPALGILVQITPYNPPPP